MIFVCENNGLSELTLASTRWVAEDRLSTCGPGIRVPRCSASTASDPAPLVKAALAPRFPRRSGPRRRGPDSSLKRSHQRIAGHYIGDAELYLRDGERDARTGGPSRWCGAGVGWSGSGLVRGHRRARGQCTSPDRSRHGRLRAAPRSRSTATVKDFIYVG